MDWFLQSGNESDVILTSKITLARNISGINFASKMSKEEKAKVYNKMKEITPGIGYGLRFLDLNSIPLIDRECLEEKHIISRNFALGKFPNSALIINDDENIIIKVNGENHIEIIGIAAGLDLTNLMNLLIEIDQKIETMIPYSYSDKYGYLTTNPADVGTGMRAYVYAHLPAIEITGNIRNLSNMVNNLSLSLKGVFGETNSIEGNIYRVSNNQTLGVTEKEVIKNLNIVANKICQQERTARKYLTKKPIDLEDSLYRSYGILTNARKIGFLESLNLISNVKLGVDLGIITELNDKKIKELYLYTKSANMANYIKTDKKLTEKEEEVERSKVIKQILTKED